MYIFHLQSLEQELNDTAFKCFHGASELSILGGAATSYRLRSRGSLLHLLFFNISQF